MIPPMAPSNVLLGLAAVSGDRPMRWPTNSPPRSAATVTRMAAKSNDRPTLSPKPDTRAPLAETDASSIRSSSEAKAPSPPT